MKASARAIHNALADERRARLVAELRATHEGLDAHELAERLGLHPNTVRWHLGVLANAGLVSSAPAPRSTRGRPRILYRLTPEGREQRTDEYRLLATILAGAVEPTSAEAAGRAWGRYLVRRPAPNIRLTEPESVAEVVELLDAQGFAAQAHGRDIHMRRCPFLELAETNPSVVCAVHGGVVSGALEQLESGLDVEALDAFVRPDLCVARLAPR